MSETVRLIFNHSQHIHGDASADFVWVITGLMRLSASCDETTLEPHLALVGCGKQYCIYQPRLLAEDGSEGYSLRA
ncbi:hypothetical protein DZC31_08670 [Stenotrophomonas rhizophila]|nr:hypothetical protein DZC31_08670 [Stenotrophomonas rhizophila]